MKKLLIISSIILVILASLPLVGNKIVESELNKRIETLSSYGINTKKRDTFSNYLDTKKHYEFVVEDADKFIEYLSKHSNAQIPPYVYTILDGTTVGVDLKYNNIPISDVVSVDIYPLALSEKAIDGIKDEDVGFGAYFEKFLRGGGLKYHLDYNVANQEFNGYIKDIDEAYAFASGQKLAIKLKASTFNGKGLLVAPELITSNTKKIFLDVTNQTNRIIINLDNTLIKSVFESTTTYKTEFKINSLDLDIDDLKTGKTKLNIQKILLELGSTTKGLKAEFSSKSSFEKLNLDTKQQIAEITGFHYDVDLKGIDKDSFEEVNKLLNKTKYNTDYQINLKIQRLLQELFMRGFELDVSDFSVKNMKINKTKDLEGMNLKLNMKLPQSTTAKTNILNPMKVLDKIDLDLFLNISKPMFVAVTRSNPIVALSKGFAKSKGNSLIYDIKMKNGSVSVNGKRVR